MDDELKQTMPDQQLSIQARATQPPLGDGASIFGLLLMARTGGVVSPWWSKQRDQDLRRFWRSCDLFAGALYTLSSRLASIPFHIEPRDESVKGHWKQAEAFEEILMEGAEFGQGWTELLMRGLMDYEVQDNGMFWEVIGAGKPDGPIKGPAVGLACLDGFRCTRTGSVDYPVIYQDTDGKRYKLHRTRVIYSAQMPSPSAEMYSVGTSWLSRCISIAQGIVDVLTYKQEKLGSRPPRMMLVGRGISDGIIAEAFKAAQEIGDNASLSRFAKVPVVANPTRTDIGVDRIDLASLPDGFNYQEDITLGMYAIALARGVPARWLWPATQTGATKADALLQHTAGLMAGTGATLQTLQVLLGGSDRGLTHASGKFLPSHLKITFDFQDDEQDRAHAENASVRSQTRERDLNAGAITVRVARQQMLEDGEIDQAQFEQMELADGRTPEGYPIETLFYAKDNRWLEGVDPKEPDLELVEERLDEARRASVQETSSERKREAWQAAAALEWLQQRQAKPVATPPEKPEAVTIGGEPEGEMETTPDNVADQEEVEEEGIERRPPSKALKVKQGRMELERQMRRELAAAMGGFQDDALEAIQRGESPDWEKWTALLLAGLVPLLSQAAVASAMDLSASIGIMFDPGEVSALASSWARSYGYELVKNVTNVTQKGLQEAMGQFLTTPAMSREQLSAMIEPLFGPVRAEMIAVTETTRAMSQGMAEYRLLLEQQLGIKSRAFWVTAADDRVCLICAPLDGKPEEKWTADFPHGPPAHPRCRCGLRLKLSIGG